MNISGVSHSLLGVTRVGPNLCTHFFWRKTYMRLSVSRNIFSSSNQLSDKIKSSGTGSGENTVVDYDGYNLDLDLKGRREMDKFKKVIEKNAYYDKYKAKIVETQKSSPKSFLGIIEQLVSGKKVDGYQPAKMNVPSKNKTLNDVMKVEMLLQVEREDIVFIWEEYHHSLNMLATTMSSQMYNRICTRAKTYSTFVLPLPKKDGFEMFLVQYSLGSFYFTPLIKYQMLKENAPVCLSLIHYTELRENKDLILMRGEWDKDSISLTEAQFLTVQLNLYYGEGDEERLNILKVFNENPSSFEHSVVIEQLKLMRTDYSHLFPELD